MDDGLWHDSFYRFVRLEEPRRVADGLKTLCREAGLLGTVLVAAEGINAMLAGSAPALGSLRAALEADVRFAGLRVNRTPCAAPPFAKLKVLLKDELVPLGLPGVDARCSGPEAAPEDWLELTAQPDVVLIDNRNAFEYELGHFRGAQNPGVANFRDFAAYAEGQLEAWRGKRVAMYCTGGIRCEKASAWLLGLGLEVYALRGGILGFFERVPQAGSAFEGACFVFDARHSVSPDASARSGPQPEP